MKRISLTSVPSPSTFASTFARTLASTFASRCASTFASTFDLRRRGPRASANVVVVVVVVALACASACSDASAPAQTIKAATVLAAARASNDRGGIGEAPKIVVEPRMDKIDGYPCHECHDETMKPDTTVRELKEAHTDIKLVHGAGRMWCTTCHGGEQDKDSLVGLKGERIDFDDQNVLCGQCHFRQQREFLYGAHGKRLETWRHDRKVAACTSCHDAHDPSFKPRKPWRGPDAQR